MKLLGACPRALDYDSMSLHCYWEAGLPRWHSSKNLPANEGDEGDPGLIPGSGRSPEGENGNPLQYSCLKNPMDCVAWRATVPRITKSWTLSDYAFSCTVYHRKLYLILYNDVYGERIWKNVGMYITGSLYCTPETNSINQLYSDKNLKQ